MDFGEKIVNFTGVKQPLVWIMENACLEGMILDKLSMNVNAFLELREIDVNTYQAINKKSYRYLLPILR